MCNSGITSLAMVSTDHYSINSHTYIIGLEGHCNVTVLWNTKLVNCRSSGRKECDRISIIMPVWQYPPWHYLI